MNTLLEKIRSRGHWRVVIRPYKFVEKRIPEITALYPLLQKCSVQLRGWDFPHLSPHTQPHIDIDWIGQEIEFGFHLEVWRFYQSGQFVHICGLWGDWQDQSYWGPPPENWQPGVTLSVGDVIFRFTEIFEFAARLALTDAGDEWLHIEITVSGLQNRELVLDLPRRASTREYKASIAELPYEVDLRRTELIAEPKELALKPALELLQWFGGGSSLETLRKWQAELLQAVR